MTRKVKGMVQLAGVTYRIIRVASGSYSVVRISDDTTVGSFNLAPQLGIEALHIEPALLREVARLAIHTAKTSYVGFARPNLSGLPSLPSLPSANTVTATAVHRRSSSPPPFLPNS